MTESILEIDKFGNKIWTSPNGQLHRIDGPAIENFDGTTEWWANGVRHRIDGPAVKWLSADYWLIEGQFHRLDGPAIESAAEPKQWYINGTNITDEVNEWIKKNNISYPFNEDASIQFKLRFL